MPGKYTVVIAGCDGREYGRSDTEIGHVEALTPAHAAHVYLERRGRQTGECQDDVQVLAVFPGWVSDEYEPGFEDDEARMTMLDMEMAEVEEACAELNQLVEA